jgi:hypothetical protein
MGGIYPFIRNRALGGFQMVNIIQYITLKSSRLCSANITQFASILRPFHMLNAQNGNHSLYNITLIFSSI